MLQEKHDFDKKALEYIFNQRGNEKSKLLQRFGDILYQSLLEYRDEYPIPFREHYTCIKVTEHGQEKMRYTEFKQLSQEILNLLRFQNAVGSINFDQGYFNALFIMDPYS